MSDDEPRPAFESALAPGRARFLARVLDHAFALGRIGPADLLRHFPPRAIMAGLEGEPQRRAQILVACTGVRMKIAIKKSAESCAEDLQIALDEEETDAEAIAALLSPDDLVRYLDARELWALASEGARSPDDPSAAASHLGRVLEAALADDLVSPAELVGALGLDTLVAHLDAPTLARALGGALEAGRAGTPFDERRLLDLVPPPHLAASLPFALVWERVVVPSIAARHGLSGDASPPGGGRRRGKGRDVAAPTQPTQPASPQPAQPASSQAASSQPAASQPAASQPAASPPPSGELDLAIDDVLDLDG
ncbi:MAG: hypothetical protein KF729_01225 [Sandaracinaceae bacterium]|nr:hypothetical protein [Sandaracinaceae bacterium]